MLKVRKTSLLLIFLGLLLFLPGTVRSQTFPANYDNERLIIKFKPFLPKIFKEAVVKSQGAQIREELSLPNSFIIEIPSAYTSAALRALERNFSVEYIEKDFIATSFVIPNDPKFSEQWGLAKIKAPAAWNKTRGSGTIDIAILDTGIDGSHPDLLGKISISVNCTESPSCPAALAVDPDGHGTHVAGIATALSNNGAGVTGIVWDGRLMNVKVLDDDGSGYYSWIINGIIFAADNGAEVINLSLGGNSSSRSLRDAVDYAWKKGVVVVAAAGNGYGGRSYPAYYPNTIAVAATDANDNKANFSNYGSWVDVAAPGVSIVSTYKGDYQTLSGTSMSTPFVTGLAALVLADHPSWTNSQVRNKIEGTADKISGTGIYWSKGRINACSALDCEAALGPTPTPTAFLTPTFTPTPTPTFIPTFSPTPTPSVAPTPIATLTPTPPSISVTPIPTPTPIPNSSLPWWCPYALWHPFCQ